MSERDRDVLTRIEALEDEMYGRDRKSGVKGKVEDLVQMTAWGRGAWWMLVKTGAVVATLIGLVWALWGRASGH